MKNNNFLDIYKGSLLAFILKSLSILSGYFLALIISKYYGSDGMGLYSISYTLLLVFCIVSVMGFDAASIKFVSENTSLHVIRSIYFKILKIIVPVSILVSLFVFVFTFIAEDIFVNKNTIINLRYVSLGILPLSLINIHAESFRGFKNIQLYSLFRFSLIPFFSCVILLLFDFSGYYSHSNPIQSYIFSIYIVFFLSTFSWFKKINFLKSKINIDNSYKKMLSVSLPMLLTTSMFYVIQWTDILILSYFETPSNIGIYNIALKISMASSIILFSINSIAAPKYSELFSLNKIEEFKNIVKFSSRMIFWFSIPIIFIVT